MHQFVSTTEEIQMPTPNSSSPGGLPSGAAGTSQATGKSAGLGQVAADKIEENRGAAAGSLDSAAAALHENADRLPGGERVASAAHTAAKAVGSAADYVRENDLKSMMADVQKLVKNNPGPALLTAAVVGFLIARTFSRD
jgi:ElaB/YqjD/DUF883 family membrane-anchored ribosome-binding protein